MTDSLPRWEFRWPDPIALQVASERILRETVERARAEGVALTDLNLRLPVLARMENSPFMEELVQALLVAPWGVERVYWHPPNRQHPPAIESAYPLEADASGNVAKGQGLLLRVGERLKPVLVGWEPETGHHFVETLLHSVREFATADEAFAMARAADPLYKSGARPVPSRMQRPVSRRQLFGFWLGG
ncbi:MAG: hypothetical protein HQL66_14150 [Magnetococcales bacterium]|nr:hypothetical protein [Magnetococcales bacterium]